MAVEGFTVERVKTNDVIGAGYYVKITRQKGTYSVAIYINHCPTGNCQLSSVAYMDQLLHVVRSADSTYTAAEAKIAKALLREAFRIAGFTPNLVLMDVKQNIYAPAVRTCFDVVNEMAYTSTNGSQMVVFIVRML